MRWRAGGRPRKSWVNCAVFWTNTRGEPDEHRSELDFAGGLRTLGWTLLHFIWQGAGLAALFAVGAAVCRSASARYALAVGALVLMLVSPVITFTWLRAQTNPAVRIGAEGATTWAGTSTQNATALSGSRAPLAGSRTEQPMGMLWLVEAWFLGVLLLSLRTAGGLML